jgi:outer membrane protein OmpA-like peptidoglycan-associated protein/tetratricopeptide (TPR) repeat protein
MKAKQVILILLVTLMAAPVTRAQTNRKDLNKVTRLQNTRRWEKEIPTYKKVLENGQFPAVMEKLADCYRITGDLENAEIWYRNALVNGNQNSTCRLNYAKVLQSNGKYQEAKDQFVLYEEITGEYEIGDKYIASCEMAMRVRDDKSRYEITPVSGLNTRYSDIVAINGTSEIVFATRGGIKEIGTHKESKRNRGDYDFFEATKVSDGTVTDVRAVKGGINSKYDDLSAVKMPGSNLVLFTRAGDKPGSKKKTLGDNQAAEEETEVRILGARRMGKKLNEVEGLPFNIGDAGHNFHPAIHPSGDMVIFASDRPGGFGGTDLYLVTREDGKWGKPVNMGPDINTPSDELFPSLNKQGYLYFASDGQIGYGGLDLFTAEMQEGKWGQVTNMGAGINSSKDDFGIAWDRTNSSGYFTSNRNSSTGDDIYRFKRTPGIMGQVFDGLSREALAGSIVRLKDISGNEKIIITDGVGMFSEPCRQNTGYLVTVDAPGFHTWRDTFWTNAIPQGRDVNMDIFLEVEQMFELNGHVFDGIEGTRLGSSDIEVIKNKKSARFGASADSADYRLRFAPGEDYTVIFRQEGYIPRIVNLSLTNFRGVQVREKNVPMVKGEFVLISGSVVEETAAKNPISRAAVTIVNNNSQEIVDSTMSLRNGTFWVAVPWDSLSNYSIISAKEGFYASSRHLESVVTKELELEVPMSTAEYGLDHSLKVINYGYNETKLTLISKKDLNEIYFFLQRNPEAKLEIRSHTDSRGTSKYNLELSRKRSDEVIKYIQARKAIPDERFVAWGFGEEYLLNDCTDGAPCSEEEHKVNRRTEIKIIGGN